MGIDTLQNRRFLMDKIKNFMYLCLVIHLFLFNQSFAFSEILATQNSAQKSAQNSAQNSAHIYKFLCTSIYENLTTSSPSKSEKICIDALEKQILLIQPDSMIQGLKHLYKDQPKMYGVKPQHTSEMRNRRKLAIENRVDQGENQGENETEIEDEKEKDEKQEKQENLEEREKRAERGERLGQFVAFLNEQVILDLLESNLSFKNQNIQIDHSSFYRLIFIRYSYSPRSPPIELN